MGEMRVSSGVSGNSQQNHHPISIFVVVKTWFSSLSVSRAPKARVQVVVFYNEEVQIHCTILPPSLANFELDSKFWIHPSFYPIFRLNQGEIDEYLSVKLG